MTIVTADVKLRHYELFWSAIFLLFLLRSCVHRPLIHNLLWKKNWCVCFRPFSSGAHRCRRDVPDYCMKNKVVQEHMIVSGNSFGNFLWSECKDRVSSPIWQNTSIYYHCFWGPVILFCLWRGWHQCKLHEEQKVRLIFAKMKILQIEDSLDAFTNMFDSCSISGPFRVHFGSSSGPFSGPFRFHVGSMSGSGPLRVHNDCYLNIDVFLGLKGSGFRVKSSIYIRISLLDKQYSSDKNTS